MTHLERQDFLENVWDYQLGQHVGLIGPTQRAGKTTTAFQLLEHTPSSFPVEVLVMKPRDRVVARESSRLGFRETDTWPPRKRWTDMIGEPPNRHAVWPKHAGDPNIDDPRHYEIFRKTMMERYRHGNGILFADELYGLSVQLGLYKESEAILTRGGGMGCGLWYACQKPSGTQRGTITSFAYNSPTHMFLSRDPDERNRKRYGELEVGNPRDIEDLTMNLPNYHWLYVNRDGPYFCTIGA